MKRKMFRILTLMLALGLCLAVAAQTAIPVLAAPPHVYESYNAGDDSSNNVYGANWYAQTFTPGVAHTIKSVKLKLYRVGSPGNVTVSIRATSSGHPAGSDLCSGIINGNGLTTNTSGAWYEITLGSGYNLSASTQYAIVVRAPSGTYPPSPANYLVWRRDASSPTYGGGCREGSTNGGSTWTSRTDRDMMFEEWGNRAPMATAQNLSVNSCSTLTVTLNGTDADGDALTAYKISALPSHGNLYDGTGTGGTNITSVPYTVTDVTHKVTYQPVSNYSGADSFGFKVNDGADDSVQASISITVSDTRSTWYQDNDVDSYGNPAVSQKACSQPSGYVLNNTDCDDTDANEHPGQTWYKDADDDGYSDGTTNTTSCTRPTGYKVASELTATSGDCNDSNPAINDCDLLNGWVEDGDPYTACNGTQVCTYQDMVYLDYSCVGGECVSTETNWRTDLIGCESCDDADPCTIDTCVNGTCVHTPIDCDYLNGWVTDGGNYTACNGTQVCTYQDMVYLDYGCVGGECVSTPTDWRTDLIGCESCDAQDYLGDWEYYCKVDQVWKHQIFHDFSCVNGQCVEVSSDYVNDQLVEDCNALDGWVADGSNYTACNGTQVCTYQDMVYLDYSCVGGECVSTETNWRTDLIGCESCDDADPCTIDTCVNGTCVHTPIDCDYLNGWVTDGGNYTACNGTQVCTYQDMVYLDYGCVGGDCVPTETDWRTDLISCESCDDADPCTIDTCVNGTCVHTPIDCDYLNGWVTDGGNYTACNGTQVCTYQDMVYLDYGCVGGECVSTETDWRTDLIGCESCDDGNPCTIDTCENGQCVHTPKYADILEYYRGLYGAPDEVSTMELLAAVDDWIADVAPPCFEEPITTLQLLELIDEWLASG
jgi:hypothetical protein